MFAQAPAVAVSAANRGGARGLRVHPDPRGALAARDGAEAVKGMMPQGSAGGEPLLLYRRVSDTLRGNPESSLGVVGSRGVTPVVGGNTGGWGVVGRGAGGQGTRAESETHGGGAYAVGGGANTVGGVAAGRRRVSPPPAAVVGDDVKEVGLTSWSQTGW